MNHTATPPGRLLPRYALTARPDGSYAATIAFPERFSGVAGVVHGGVISMWFDEVLGSVANHNPGDWWATAYLKVDYRVPSLIGQALTAVVQPPEREGRKCKVHARILAGDLLCAEAEGLFVKMG